MDSGNTFLQNEKKKRFASTTVEAVIAPLLTVKYDSKQRKLRENHKNMLRLIRAKMCGSRKTGSTLPIFDCLGTNRN